MQKRCSVQVTLSLPGLPEAACQSEMLAEWGTAPGAGGHKDKLIPDTKTAKPLPGQTELV